MQQNSASSLELPIDVMRSMCDVAMKRVLDHLEHVGDQHAGGDVEIASAQALCRSMREPAPEQGAPLDALLDDLFDKWLPRSLTTNGPGYLAYVPGGGIFPAAIADFVADTTNRFTGAWFAAPALVQLEANVLDWLRDWMHFPATTRGALHHRRLDGHVQRHRRRARAPPRHAHPRRRALHVDAGASLGAEVGEARRHRRRSRAFPARRCRLSPADRRARAPPLPRIAAPGSCPSSSSRARARPTRAPSTRSTPSPTYARRDGLWHHVDGAYGAFFHACESLRPLLAGLSRADSLTLDPHKGLFLPYGTGALLVRDGSALRAVHAASADYLPGGMPSDIYDPSEHGPDLSRGFPGLSRVVDGEDLRRGEAPRRHRRQARARGPTPPSASPKIPGVVMVAPPQLSLFAFHVTWSGASLEEENAATRRVLARVAARGRVVLSGCNIAGRELARVCVLSFRTAEANMDACVEDVTEAVSKR